jgi:DNA-binding MarR family transcriptional regulator
MPIRLAIDDPSLHAWFILHQVMDSLTKYEEMAYAKAGLSYQQFAVLTAIKFIKDPVKQTDVANWLDRNTNTVSAIINRMEKDGLLKRVRDLKDHRAVRLVLTLKGERRFKKAMKPARELPEQVLSCFSGEELDCFRSLLEKLREHTYEKRSLKSKVIDMGEDNLKASFDGPV